MYFLKINHGKDVSISVANGNLHKQYCYIIFQCNNTCAKLFIIPPVTKNVSKYHTRNSENYIVPISRLELYKKKSVPDTIWKWNFLYLEVREGTSLNIFKKNLGESIPQLPK